VRRREGSPGLPARLIGGIGPGAARAAKLLSLLVLNSVGFFKETKNEGRSKPGTRCPFFKISVCCCFREGNFTRSPEEHERGKADTKGLLRHPSSAGSGCSLNR